MSKVSDQLSDVETQRRLDRALKRSLQMKPQKHKPLKKTRASGTAKKKPSAKPHHQ
jgi:hypothetical protein